MANQQLTQLLALVEDKCTVRTVQDLLRKAKAADKTLRVSEATKSAIIHHNLRQAIEKSVLSIDDVYKVLCAAEENGSQHIFYYVPRTEALALQYTDSEAIASRLFGRKWREEKGFPQFMLEPEGVVWSDFRIEAISKKVSRWTAKIYSGIRKKRLIDEKKEGTNRIILTYEYELRREILLARWHSFGLLELRVPRDSSRAIIIDSLNTLWHSISGAVSKSDFCEWDLVPAATRLVKEYEQHPTLYSRGVCRAIDPQGGTGTFCPPSSEEELGSDRTRSRAMRQYDRYEASVITWLPQKTTDALESELRTVICSIDHNEVLIGAKATAGAVDYITFRLREFSVVVEPRAAANQ